MSSSSARVRGSHRTPIGTRLSRIVRLTAHLFRGLAILTFRFPALDARHRAQTIRRWSRQLMAILHVRVRCIDEPHEWPARTMLIANHVSWLDIFAILSVVPSVFVAKSEIRGWPFIGRLVAMSGTIFIERGSRRHARTANDRIAEALREGTIVAFCPEGTTTDGTHLLKFHAALFQPAIVAEATLQPVALRYRDRHDAPTLAAAYVGDMSLLDSILAISAEPRMSVELRFTEPIVATGGERRALAALAHERVSRALASGSPHTAPESPIDRPVAAL